MLLADDGHGLLVDCGLFDREFLDLSIERMKERLGLRAIDAIFVTHMHGDHALDAAHVREKHGAALWTMEGIADKFERPYDFDFAALLPSYNKEAGPLRFDRVLRDGETFQWGGYDLTCDWMPGQTKYHCCLHGMIDGQKTAFTGDNIFGSGTDPRQGGNEAVVARNGGALEEGYLYAASYLHGLAPDLLLGGHCWAISKPAELISRMAARMEQLRTAFRGLAPEDEYRYTFDPYWVCARPYRATVPAGGTADVVIAIRNYRPQMQTHRISLRASGGLAFDPPVIEGKLQGEGETTVVVNVRAEPGLAEGLRMVALDIERDGVRNGELFDFIVWVNGAPA